MQLPMPPPDCRLQLALFCLSRARVRTGSMCSFMFSETPRGVDWYCPPNPQLRLAYNLANQEGSTYTMSTQFAQMLQEHIFPNCNSLEPPEDFIAEYNSRAVRPSVRIYISC